MHGQQNINFDIYRLIISVPNQNTTICPQVLFMVTSNIINREGRNNMALCISKRTEHIHVSMGYLSIPHTYTLTSFGLTHTVINIYQI
jgi:hypothetical protein